MKMYNSNSTWKIGNVTKDVFYKQGEGDKKSFCSFRIAVDVDKDSTVFFPVKCFAFTADSCADLKKGDKVVVVGRDYEDAWKKDDGEEVKALGVVAECVGVVVRPKKEEF